MSAISAISAISAVVRFLTLAFALFIVFAMARHLVEDTYAEYVWPVVAYLCAALVAAAALVWPRIRHRTRIAAAAPFLLLLVAGFLLA